MEQETRKFGFLGALTRSIPKDRASISTAGTLKQGMENNAAGAIHM
jgi:hypothetical protein